MNKQKKPLYWYYIVILIVLLVVNMIIGPMFSNSHIREVTYSDFLDAIEEKEILELECKVLGQKKIEQHLFAPSVIAGMNESVLPP